MTTTLDLAGIKSRDAARTPGEWQHELDMKPPGNGIEQGGGFICHVAEHGNVNTVARTGEYFSHADADWIAACSRDVPALVARVEELEQAIRAEREKCGRMRDILERIRESERYGDLGDLLQGVLYDIRELLEATR